VGATIEIVRFEVAADRHDELVAGHTAARRAIRAVSPPGTLWSRLTRSGETGWIELVAWVRREVFDRALERSADDPVAGAWFRLAEPGYTILLGEIAEEPLPPPRDGELQLSWWRNGAAAESPRPGGAWGLQASIDSRAWTDTSGWIEGDPMSLLITDGGEGEGEEEASVDGGPDRERVAIAHAVDPTEEAA